MNISYIDFTDAAEFTASFIAKWRSETAETAPGIRTLDLDILTLAQWRRAELFVGRLEQMLRSLPPLAGIELGTPQIVDMDPGSFVPWQYGEGPAVFMCMTRSPGLRLMCGLELVAPAPGDVLLVNRHALYSVINQCAHPAVFLYAPFTHRAAGAA